MLSCCVFFLLMEIAVLSAVDEDQYVGICGTDAVHKSCFARSTLRLTNDTSTYLIDATYSNPICPTKIQTSKSYRYLNDFHLYPFKFQCSKVNISIFLPRDNKPMAYDLKPFREVSGTRFLLLTECYLTSCKCIVINVRTTKINIINAGSGFKPTIETIPLNMTKLQQIYTMSESLEMIVVTGTAEQLSDTYLNSNDSVSVFCVGDSVRGTRGLLQLVPLPSATSPLPPSPYLTLSMRSYSSQHLERYLAMTGVTDWNQVPSDWDTYVKDFNQTLTYYLLVVQWSNVSGSLLTSHEAECYNNYIFNKAEFTYRKLTEDSPTATPAQTIWSATTTGLHIMSPSSVLNSSEELSIPTPSTTYGLYTYVVGMCTYLCDSAVLPINTSDPVQRQMLERQLHELKKQLAVNKTELSSTKRRKESAMDHRVSAKAFGLVGTAMLCTCFGIIILVDLSKVSKALLDFRVQVCEPDVIQVKQSKMRRPSRVRKQSYDKLIPFIGRRNRVSSETLV